MDEYNLQLQRDGPGGDRLRPRHPDGDRQPDGGWQRVRRPAAAAGDLLRELGQLGALGFSGHSPTFGDFTVTTTGPTFVMKAQNLPNARVDHFEADGVLTGAAITGTYKVFFKDATTGDGVFSLAKS